MCTFTSFHFPSSICCSSVNIYIEAKMNKKRKKKEWGWCVAVVFFCSWNLWMIWEHDRMLLCTQECDVEWEIYIEQGKNTFNFYVLCAKWFKMSTKRVMELGKERSFNLKTNLGWIRVTCFWISFTFLNMIEICFVKNSSFFFCSLFLLFRSDC